jgi:hypothetical protein
MDEGLTAGTYVSTYSYSHSRNIGLARPVHAEEGARCTQTNPSASSRSRGTVAHSPGPISRWALDPWLRLSSGPSSVAGRAHVLDCEPPGTSDRRSWLTPVSVSGAWPTGHRVRSLSVSLPFVLKKTPDPFFLARPSERGGQNVTAAVRIPSYH